MNEKKTEVGERERDSRDFAWSIYQHADNLQHQRHANALAAQAFLFAAAGIADWENHIHLCLLISIFGAVMSILWWLYTIRLERPEEAILRVLRKFPEYKVYDLACWKCPPPSFLVNDLPPSLTFAIWSYFSATNVGLINLRIRWILLSFAIGMGISIILYWSMKIWTDCWFNAKRKEIEDILKTVDDPS